MCDRESPGLVRRPLLQQGPRPPRASEADASVLAAVVDAAQQAAQRASWAAVAAVSYGDSEDFDREWHQKMRRAAVQAAEVAEQYARDCAVAVSMVGKGDVITKVVARGAGHLAARNLAERLRALAYSFFSAPWLNEGMTLILCSEIRGFRSRMGQSGGTVGGTTESRWGVAPGALGYSWD